MARWKHESGQVVIADEKPAGAWIKQVGFMDDDKKEPLLPSAQAILQLGINAMAERAATRDMPTGERSMARAVAIFEAQSGVKLTESQGWMFMVCIKQARAAQGAFNPDDYIDMAAYAALAGECGWQE